MQGRLAGEQEDQALGGAEQEEGRGRRRGLQGRRPAELEDDGPEQHAAADAAEGGDHTSAVGEENQAARVVGRALDEEVACAVACAVAAAVGNFSADHCPIPFIRNANYYSRVSRGDFVVILILRNSRRCARSAITSQ